MDIFLRIAPTANGSSPSPRPPMTPDRTHRWHPPARPPVSESSCGMPLETISGAGCTSRREAGTTAASLGIAPTWAKISAVFSAADDRGDDRGEKIKGRPVAADEKIGEADILFSQLSGNAEGRMSPGEAVCSLFVRLSKYPSPACPCQAGRLLPQMREISSKSSMLLHIRG